MKRIIRDAFPDRVAVVIFSAAIFVLLLVIGVSTPGEHTSDDIFVAINTLMVSRVIYFNLHEARHGWKEWRVTNTVRATFASIYLVSYIVLFTGFIDRLYWSHIMIGVSPVVWELCWTQPSKSTRRVRNSISREVTSLEERRREAA